MATTRQIEANRKNAQNSTGPTSDAGKAVARLNAVRHSVLSTVALAPAEVQTLFEDLLAELDAEFNPATPLEQALVEKIAVALWRSRRLLEAEAAVIALRRTPDKLAQGVAVELSGYDRNCVAAHELEPLDPETRAWCEAVLAEAPAAEGASLADLPKKAPTICADLVSDAEGENLSVEDYLDQEYEGALSGWLEALLDYCRAETEPTGRRARLRSLARDVQARAAVPSLADAQLVGRYQTMLDNQLYKAITALREAQATRRETLEAEPDN